MTNRNHMYNFRFSLSLTLSILLINTTCEEPIEDTTPPTVSIQSPISGQTVSEIVIISVSAQDNEGVELVEFFIDDSLHYTDSGLPYKHAWNTTAYRDSSQHIIKAISFDEAGNLTESQPVLVWVDNSHSYPAPVNIISISYTLSEMIITWEMSNESDFEHYELLISYSEHGDRSALTVVTEASDTVYSITDFDPTIESWYWVGVTDTVGLYSLGEGYIVVDNPPSEPNLLPISYSDNSFPISWERNSAQDFESYTLYEATLVDMSDEAAILTTTDQTTTEYVVYGIGFDEYRYYRLVVKDIWGLESTSSIRTASSYLRIVFSSDRDGDSQIYNMDMNGNDLIRLTDAGPNSRPRYSPDGSQILFRSTRDGNREIYIMNADGSNQQNLSTHSHPDENPIFTPDGLKVVFDANRDGNHDIYSMDSDGSDQLNLSSHPAYETLPILSSDGSYIIFRANRGSGGNGEVFRMNMDGSAQTNLTNMDGHDLALDISINSVVVFIAFGEGHSGLYTMNIDGSNKQRIDGTDSSARFSPDGTKLIYGGGKLMMNSDGTNKVALNGSIGGEGVQFSPDSRTIIYWSGAGIYTYNLDTGHLQYLGNGKFPWFQPR